MKSYWGAYASAQKITEMTKLLKICCIFNTNRIHFEIVRRRTEMTYQQRCAALGRALLNVLLASRVTCWRRTF